MATAMVPASAGRVLDTRMTPGASDHEPRTRSCLRARSSDPFGASGGLKALARAQRPDPGTYVRYRDALITDDLADPGCRCRRAC
jgi:hypothetical protein